MVEMRVFLSLQLKVHKATNKTYINQEATIFHGQGSTTVLEKGMDMYLQQIHSGNLGQKEAGSGTENLRIYADLCRVEGLND